MLAVAGLSSFAFADPTAPQDGGAMTDTPNSGATTTTDDVAIPEPHGSGIQNRTPQPAAVAPTQDIVEIAGNAQDFSTLVVAIEAAGLTETLKGDGPFTIFAPTNTAFEALPEGVLAKLMEPENKNMLASILTYHVIPGKVMSADIVTMKAKTIGGSESSITQNGDVVMVDGAKVVKTDVEASNGVIHVVDKVLMPPVPESE